VDVVSSVIMNLRAEVCDFWDSIGYQWGT